MTYLITHCTHQTGVSPCHADMLRELRSIISCQEVINSAACGHGADSSKRDLIQKALADQEGNPVCFHAVVGNTLTSVSSGGGAAVLWRYVGLPYPRICHQQA